MKKDLSQLQNKGTTFFRLLSNQYHNEFDNTKLIYFGIVEDIDRLGNDNRPRFSILTRIIGIDPIDSTFKSFRWIKPLFPIHLMSLPELGEQITIIPSEINNFDNAFWISTYSTKNKLTRTFVGEDIIDTINSNGDPSSKYGVQKDLETLKDIDTEPNHEYNIPDDRNKPGDVIIYGRSNTQIRQSFDSKTQNGYIELVTEKDKINENEFYKNDFTKINGGRIIISTKTDLDTKIIEENNKLKFDNKFINKKLEVPYTLIEAEQIRFISPRGGDINNMVLAQKQSEWLEKILNLVGDVIDKINTLNTKISTHKHMGTGPTSPPLPPELIDFTTKLQLDFKLLKSNILNEKDTIINHHSKNIGIN
jgi:hypothetical protein